MPDGKINTTMLEALMKKKAWVLQAQEKTGKNMSAAVAEVDKQISEILQRKLATKSGKED